MRMLRQAGVPILLLFLLSFSTQPGIVRAYGTEGHRIVANLCWYLLPKQIKDEISDLLDEAKFGYFCKDAWQIFSVC